ncbi:MAG TPA: PhoH family protein, partial [Thermoanaerobaculia bacterium]
KLLGEMQELIEQGYPLKKSDVSTGVRVLRDRPDTNLVDFFTDDALQAAVRRVVTPRNVAQKLYLQSMQEFDITIAIGPAGTGKTFLGVAAAAAALSEKSIKRIVLCRPAVEAGERLGFLPGDIAEKVNPYLRPLYDSLYDIIGYEKVDKLMERGVIEIAPLAFMRGRTLNDSFIILDEAQNTTPEQMKMFLTRLGFGSKAVVTGDVTQVDLPEGKKSGLREAHKILRNVEGIRFFEFSDRDVVRHPLVQKIVVAYDRADKERTQS